MPCRMNGWSKTSFCIFIQYKQMFSKQGWLHNENLCYLRDVMSTTSFIFYNQDQWQQEKNDARFSSLLFIFSTHPTLMKIFLRRRVLKNFLNETLEKFVHLAYLLWLIPRFCLFSFSLVSCSLFREHTPDFNLNECMRDDNVVLTTSGLILIFSFEYGR